MNKIVEWLKQQSTQKAIAAFTVTITTQFYPQLGLTEAQVIQTLSYFFGIYALLAAFRDKS